MRIIQVNSCDGCPHHSFRWIGKKECMLCGNLRCPAEHRDEDRFNVEGIPDWCPLDELIYEPSKCYFNKKHFKLEDDPIYQASKEFYNTDEMKAREELRKVFDDSIKGD